MGKRKAHRIIVLSDFAVFLPFLFLLAVLIFIEIFLTNSLDDNSKGVRLFKNKDFSLAAEAFSRAIDKNYLHSFAHLNLALSQDLSNSPVKALNIYSFVSKKFKQLAKFYAHFNQGELNGRLGKIKEALKQYQSALEFQIKTAQIKENIEYLFLSQTQSSQSKEGEEQESQPQTEGEDSDTESGNKGNLSSKEEGEESGHQKKEKGADHESKEASSSKQSEQKKDRQSEGESIKDSSKTDVSSDQQSDQQFKKEDADNKDQIDSSLKQDEQDSQQEGGDSRDTNTKSHSHQQMDSESKTSKGKVLNEIETKAILDTIEKQESEIRARMFRSKSIRQSRPREKDW